MTISYVGAGTVAFLLGNGNLTVPLPTGLADDDIVFVALQGRAWINPTNPNPSMTGGWTAIHIDAASGNTIIRVYWKRVTAGESDPVLTYSGGNPTQDHMLARAVAYRGVRVTGDPWDVEEVITYSNPTTTTPDFIAFAGSSLEDNSRVAYFVGSNRPDATGVNYTSGWTISGLTDVQQRTDDTHDSFIGSGLFITDGLDVVAGSIGVGTFTTVSAASRNFISLGVIMPPEPDAIPDGYWEVLLDEQ